MDSRRLAILRELSERGSITAVADEMKVTASAVSQQLKILEREAGIALVEPLGRGVKLTAAGRKLAELATDLAVASQRTTEEWRRYMDYPAGDVELTIFPTGGQMLLPGVLKRVRDEPQVTLMCTDIDPATQSDVAELTTRFDIVVADSPHANETWRQRRLHIVPLMTEPLDVAVPVDHRLARRKQVSPSDLVGETWIGVPEGFPYDRVLAQIVAETGEPANITQRFNDNGIVEAVVAAGHGIAILPRFTTRDRINGLVTLPLTGGRAQREIAALVRPDRMERHSVRFVVDALVAEAHGVRAVYG